MLWRRNALKDLFNSGLFLRSSSNVIYGLIITNKFILNLIFACEIAVYRKLGNYSMNYPQQDIQIRSLRHRIPSKYNSIRRQYALMKKHLI